MRVFTVPQRPPTFKHRKQKRFGQDERLDKQMPITECVCLRPKMYSILMEEKNIQKLKGTKKYGVKKEIRHMHYKEVLFGNKSFRHDFHDFQAWDLWGASEQNLAAPIWVKAMHLKKRHRLLCLQTQINGQGVGWVCHGVVGGRTKTGGTNNNSSRRRPSLGPSYK